MKYEVLRNLNISIKHTTLTIPKTFTLLDTNYHATVQLLSRFFGSEKVRVLVAVHLNTGELTLFPILFTPTKPCIVESFGDAY